MGKAKRNRARAQSRRERRSQAASRDDFFLHDLRTDDNIIIPERHRPLDPKVVDTLVESMQNCGMQAPICVRWTGDDAPYTLIYGRHRLEAARKLGWDHIDARVFDCTEDRARILEITENLHRAELSVLERAQHIDEWRRLTEAKAKGARPDEDKQLEGKAGKPAANALVWKRKGRGTEARTSSGHYEVGTRLALSNVYGVPGVDNYETTFYPQGVKPKDKYTACVGLANSGSLKAAKAIAQAHADGRETEGSSPATTAPKDKGAQVAHPGGKQPKDKGVSKAAKKLGISRREVERAEKIAKITPEAMKVATDAGIADNQSKLLKVAATPAKEQVAKVRELSRRKTRSTGKVRPRATTPPAAPPPSNPPHATTPLAATAPPSTTNPPPLGKRKAEEQRKETLRAIGARAAEDLLARSRDAARWIFGILEEPSSAMAFTLRLLLEFKIKGAEESEEAEGYVVASAPVVTGNTADPAASAEEMKARHAAEEAREGGVDAAGQWDIKIHEYLKPKRCTWSANKGSEFLSSDAGVRFATEEEARADARAAIARHEAAA